MAKYTASIKVSEFVDGVVDYVSEFQYELDAENENLAHIHMQEYIELHVLRGENNDNIHAEYALREGK
jgi:hypothetical protein